MATVKEERRLGEILVKLGIVTSRQLDEVLEEQEATGRYIGEILVSRGLASEEQITKSLSEQLGLAFVDVGEMTIEPEAVKLLSREACERLNAVPIFTSQDKLTVAMANALDVQAIDEMQIKSGLKVRPVFGCLSAIRNAIEKAYPAAKPDAGASAFGTPDRGAGAINRAPTPEGDPNSLQKAANLAPVIEIVNELITRAVEMSASDIHIEPERESFHCRYRLDGVLHLASQIPVQYQAAVVSRVKIMANMDIAEKRLPQDGRVRMTIAGKEVDMRISTFPSIHGENLVIRILDRSSGILKMTQLGFSDKTLQNFSEMIRRPYGIILVTGPTGSGKTTTLYTALSEINRVEKNILTLEDPVEYELPNIRQSQINVKAGLTFAAGLRSILRQDPDIIMIGEIRDRETADIAIHAALTGHLVFSTLHTNDAPSAATRLVDMGVEPFLVASSVIGIVAQRLIRLLCPACKQPYTPSEEMIKQIAGTGMTGIQIAGMMEKGAQWYKEAGCKKCKQYGYSGRCGIFEFLVPNEGIKELIAEKTSAAKIRELATKSGMQTLRASGLEKVVKGQTSMSEVLRVTEDDIY